MGRRGEGDESNMFGERGRVFFFFVFQHTYR